MGKDGIRRGGNKKFGLMLTRCAKAYSSSYLQLSQSVSSHFVAIHLKVCAQKSIKPLILGVQGLSKSPMLTRQKLVTSTHCDRHAHAHLQPFSLSTALHRWKFCSAKGVSAVHSLEWRNGTCPFIHPHSNYYMRNQLCCREDSSFRNRKAFP